MNMKLIAMFLSTFAAACSSGPIAKAALDDEVRRLCAFDGGIKVYETLKLPADKFNEWGQVNFYNQTQGENSLGEQYIFRSETKYYQKGNPELWRSHYQVIRRLDGKLLGESISYSRRGGDVSGPWHESSYGCPEDRGDIQLLMRVFQK